MRIWDINPARLCRQHLLGEQGVRVRDMRGTAFRARARERTSRATTGILAEGAMTEHEPDEAAAAAAALTWLEFIDRGDADGSWPGTSEAFQRAVPPELWRSSLERAQAGMGRPLARTLDSAKYATELPGAPDGEYVVLQYATRFEHKARGGETVTLSREGGGSWKVGGYFVR
jgi:hypothetical protein